VPTTVSTTAGQYATALGNSRKLFRDAYGKYIAVFKNANVMLAYCNNDPPTSGWNVYDLGSTYAVDAGEQFGVAAAYDSTNDRLMICWVGSGSPKFAQVTFTRDANHNITSYTVGSVLTITPAYSPAHAPSLWLLHNGEVAAVWGADKTSGAKHSVVEFARIVFGSPPTYKNAAGTASSKDTISSDYTTSFIIRYPCIVQRTNSGTGQYDLYAIYTDGDTSYKVKATWTGSAWTWGTQAYTATHMANAITSANYDVTNGLIVYTLYFAAYATTTFPVGTIASDDTDTDISLTGLPSALRKSPSLVTVGGDYYIFYQMNNDIYYVKRSGGSWSSETQFTTTANENYPSCKIDGAGNRVELIWTHYTGSAYNVYYDYLPLAVGITVTVTDNVGLSDVALCNKTLAVTDSVGLADTPLKGWTPTVTDAVSLFETVLRNKAFSILDSVGLADVVYRGKQLTLTDAVSLTDAILRDKQFAVQDVLNLLDAVLSHKQLQISDTVSLADVALALKTLLLTDSISLSDAVEVLAGAIIKVVEDSVGLSDAVYRNKSLIISDTVSLVEQVLRHKPLLPVSDVLTLAEVVSISKLLAVSDAIGLTDVAEVLKQLRVSDSVTLVDAAQVPSRILAVLDSVGLSDVAKIDKALIVSDQIALVEVVYAFLPVKKTKLFLVIGNLAIQLTGD
jgi:hypothetical protein